MNDQLHISCTIWLLDATVINFIQGHSVGSCKLNTVVKVTTLCLNQFDTHSTQSVCYLPASTTRADFSILSLSLFLAKTSFILPIQDSVKRVQIRKRNFWAEWLDYKLNHLGSIPDMDKIYFFSFLQRTERLWGDHPASYPNGTECIFLGSGKVGGVWCWSRTLPP
jgi:hypothetical protein